MSRPTIAFVFLPKPNTMIDVPAQSQYQALSDRVRENSGAQRRKLRSRPPKSVVASYDSVARKRKTVSEGQAARAGESRERIKRENQASDVHASRFCLSA